MTREPTDNELSMEVKIARSDAQILAYGLLAEGLDVEHLTPQGRLELLRAIDKVLDLCGVKGAEIVPDAVAGRFVEDVASVGTLLVERELRAEVERLSAENKELRKGQIIRLTHAKEAVAEIERLTAIVQQHEIWQASLVQQLVDKDAEIERLQRHIYTLEGMLGEMNIAVPERAALEPKP